MSITKVGTIGHIDHGKTSLVEALTGIDADRLRNGEAAIRQLHACLGCF